MSTLIHNFSESILVTGGAGYIGSHFVYRFLSERPQARVIMVDNLSTGNQEVVSLFQKWFPGRFLFHQSSIGDASVRQVLVEHPVHAAVHFAARALVAESQKNPILYYVNNVSQTIQLLETLLSVGVFQFVFSSTAAVYGIPEVELITEETEKKPVNVYGQSKWQVENVLQDLRNQGQLSYIALRYFNAAGAQPGGKLGELHADETHLIPLVLHAANTPGGKATVWGKDYATPDGTCIRDYIHVDDLASAHIAALDYLGAYPGTGEAINLSTGKGNSVLEVIQQCAHVVGRDIPVEYGPRRPGDPPVLVANPRKAHRLLGWSAKYGLQEMIQTAWQWESGEKFASAMEALQPVSSRRS